VASFSCFPCGKESRDISAGRFALHERGSAHPRPCRRACRQERRSLVNLILVMGVFGGSVIAGPMLTYTLNWFEHGAFGVQLDVWRNATPALTRRAARRPTCGTAITAAPRRPADASFAG
jgi:hypothetical protein